ncbi:Protein nud1 [Vanrija albida]|uniref:Protein nud1 n=1 Tax=Vanrija albida TaxID=181172 RepID=A0ABR3Q753_9TREE
MAAYTPAWQTEELLEEWVETSPSPPGSPSNRNSPSPALQDGGVGSINAKRGSLRSLGTGSAARALPPSRKSSLNNGPEFTRSPSNPFIRKASGMPSPPTSASGTSASGASEDGEHEHEEHKSPPAAGTFLVKEGEESHGHAFPKNPFGAGRDMFAALPLERMFEPPSPPVASGLSASPPPMSEPAQSPPAVSPEASPSPPPGTPGPSYTTAAISRSTSPKEPPPESIQRRLSHQYAPVNPSRLSKSITPSDNSFATTADSSRAPTPPTPALPDDEEDGEADLDLTGVYESPGVSAHLYTGHSGLPNPQDLDDGFSSPERSERLEFYNRHDVSRSPSKDIDSMLNTTQDASSVGPSSMRELPTPDRDSLSPIANNDYQFTFEASVPDSPGELSDPPFDPSSDQLPNGDPSHSTLRHRAASANVGLRLFHHTYDTYTRDHLSALVDSIAGKGSLSPEIPDARGLRDWSPAVTNSAGSPDSRGFSATPSSSSSDARSSKRLRMSPPSPGGPPPARDWHARGRLLMDRLRIQDDDLSATSDSVDSRSMGSRSQTRTNSQSRTFSGSEGATHYDNGPTFDYSDVPPTPPVEYAPRPEDAELPPYHRSNPSTASSAYLDRASQMLDKIKGRKVSPSTSTADESDRNRHRVLSESTDQRVSYPSSLSSETKDRVPLSKRKIAVRQLSSESPSWDENTSSQQSSASPEPQAVRPHAPGLGNNRSREDLNRFISSSTVATATTMSTSFVKHSGPRDPTRSGVTVIRPGDVADLVPNRIGKMRLDPSTMRWVRDVRDGSLTRVDEAGESRAAGSDESADPFAGFDSSGEQDQSQMLVEMVQPVVVGSSETSETSDSESANSLDERAEDITPPVAERPPLTHSTSAPPILATPTPATPGAQAGLAPNNPLRSALRNANSTPSSAVKKQLDWHPELTPRPARGDSAAPSSTSFKRSVSFSDGHIVRTVEVESVSIRRHQRQPSHDDDLFSDGGEATAGTSWQPSTRTRRIQHALDGLADLTLEDISPSKPAREAAVDRVPIRPIDDDEEEEQSDESIQVPTRFSRSKSSFRSRAGANATFLTECSFGVAHDRLVQLITDVQPFEPYWEQLRSIDLSHKGVESLARLKEFLPALDEAKLNDNAIDYLSGIPSTVRTLHVAGNRLSSLTSVNHLRNLQYLDISRNQLDSVSQLECLVHLRELKADDNSITDISGIMNMDGLVKLSVSGNKIEKVDFERARWDKLETINLSNNRIRSIKDLHRLKSVNSINLDKNQLSELEPQIPMTSVRTLRFSDNKISELDLSLFPKVRTLFADGNALPGLSRSRSGGNRIENLSLRNQRVQRFVLTSEDMQCVKRLYISGNRLDPDFLPSTPVYSLVYLEAAACNLTSWPSSFASRLPNLRILNVNYNFLPDLDALRGLMRIRKIMAVGNRLGGGAKGAVRGLKGLTTLEEVDLRMNPSTLSFYLPILLPKAAAPSVGQAGADASAPDSTWPALDAQFRRQLPDEWYSKRLVYRGMVMAVCPDLRTLDGVVVEEGEKKKAAMLIEYAREARAEGERRGSR